jgi:hypothetical protein
MPTTTAAEVTAYAHCTEPRCRGYRQEQVQVVRTEDAYTYAEKGGDLPGIENSFVHWAFADPSEATCRHCGATRDISEAPRPQYANISQFDPEGLLKLQDQGVEFDPQAQAEYRAAPVVDEERQAMQSKIDELSGMVQVLLAQSQQPEPPEIHDENPPEPEA